MLFICNQQTAKNASPKGTWGTYQSSEGRLYSVLVGPVYQGFILSGGSCYIFGYMDTSISGVLYRNKKVIH